MNDIISEQNSWRGYSGRAVRTARTSSLCCPRLMRILRRLPWVIGQVANGPSRRAKDLLPGRDGCGRRQRVRSTRSRPEASSLLVVQGPSVLSGHHRAECEDLQASLGAARQRCRLGAGSAPHQVGHDVADGAVCIAGDGPLAAGDILATGASRPRGPHPFAPALATFLFLRGEERTGRIRA